MSAVAGFLHENIAMTLFLCLSLGYFLGKIKIRSFTVGATAGSLVVSLLIGLFLQTYAEKAAGGADLVSGPVSNVFFALFFFTIGFEVGPDFFRSLRTAGVKVIILAVFFSAAGFGAVFALSRLFQLDAGYGAGLIAGALTQTSVLKLVSGGLNANASVAYAVTYAFGTIGVILFVRKIGPAMLRRDLFDITKEKVDSLAHRPPAAGENSAPPMIQVRAYEIMPSSEYCGLGVEEAEERNGSSLEIEAVYRDGECLTQFDGLRLQAGDVIQAVGSVKALDRADNKGLNEVSDSRYFQIKLKDAEIVLTRDFSPETEQLLSDHGILVKNQGPKERLTRHSVLSVTGPARAIANAARQIGYLKQDGNATDVPFVTLLIAAGLAIGAVSVSQLSLGSVAVMIIGMLAGWYYSARHRNGYIPSSARWLLKSIGLNMFIAVSALNASAKLMESPEGWLAKIPSLLAAGVLVTLIPYVLSLLFGKYVLKIDDADLLGGLSGCGTCSAGLNALTEETNSSVYAVGYAPGCAAGNILLMVIAKLFIGIY